MEDWKDNALTRSWSQTLKGADSTFTITKCLMAPGQEINKVPVITIEKVTTKEVDGKKSKEKSKMYLTFDDDRYESSYLVEYCIKEGQELESGNEIAILKYRIPETVRNLMELSITNMVKKRSDLHMKGNIPAKKLANAVAAYGNNLDQERVLFLYDSTVWGSAKEGFLITDSSIINKDLYSSFTIRFNEIQEVTLKQTKKDDKLKEMLTVSLKEGTAIEIEGTCETCTFSGLKDFLDYMMVLREEGHTKDVDGIVILEDMPQEVIVAYLQSLLWLTYQDDELIDAKELSELQILMAQLNCNAEVRHLIRTTVSDPNTLDIETLHKQLIEGVPSGSEQALGISLVKDCIRIHRSTCEGSAIENMGIKKIADIVGFNDEQINFVEEACIQDEKILSGEISDDELTAAAKSLAAKGAAVGVPIAAIYLSGSVVGLSAAGITSGLGALGLGGVLGLSSMVTGIGAVVILGIGVYKGVQWLSGGKGREKVARRENMLKEVIMYHQKTIGNLGEDIAFISDQLMEALKDAVGQAVHIEKLMKQMSILGNALKGVRKKEQVYEKDYQEEVEKRAA